MAETPTCRYCGKWSYELQTEGRCTACGRISPTHNFRRKIESLIQKEREGATGTPDFILAAYLKRCLERFPQEGVSGQEVIDNWTRIFGEAP